MKFSYFLWETFKLKMLITFSKTIPSEVLYKGQKYDLKGTLKKRLVNYFIPKRLSLIKGLFQSITFEHSYDLFTSSILAIHYKNWLSVQILIRAQIEILLFTRWIEENPDKIKDVFNEELYKKYSKKIYKKEEKDPFILSLLYAYNRYYSKKAHPFPTRFMSSISLGRFLKPKIKTEEIDLDSMINGSFNKLPKEERNKRIGEWFEFGSYSPGVNAIPHHKKNEREVINDITTIIYLYDEINKNLESIQEKCEDYKMEDVRWDKAIKDYKKD